MDEGVASYIDAIEADQRPRFDRVHRLIIEVQPDVEMVLSYKMPAYVSGARRLHVGVWKHGLSFYGWERGRDAAHISDDELREFAAAVLG